MNAFRRFVRYMGMLLILCGCASYSGRGLVPGDSTRREVEQVMGLPVQRIDAANGDSLWFYPHNPEGLDTYAVRIGPDGVVRAVEQVLTMKNLRQIAVGKTTAQEVDELIGPPWRITHVDRAFGEDWEYRMYDDTRTVCNLIVRFSATGTVRDVLLLKDFSIEPGDHQGGR